MPRTTVDDVLLSLRDAGLGDPDPAGVDAVCRARLQAELERGQRRGRNWFGTAARFATAVGAVVAIAGATYAVPVTRAAVDDVYSAMSNWVSADAGSAPGRAVSAAEDVPSWVATESGEKRVLAEADGQKLFAIRQGDKITFALANFAESATIDDWRKTIDGKKIVEVGPGRFLPNGRHDRRPFFGVVAGSVKRIQLNYADGAPPVSQAGLDGAFALTVDANRRPRSLTGYDEGGRLVARLDMPYGDFRYCPDAARGCPPWPKP
jgi:hypothetical protein